MEREHTYPKLHNAMWPGLVGKDSKSGQPPISLMRMLALTCGARAGEATFEGVDLFLFEPHINPDASDDDLRRLADTIKDRGLSIGSLVAPVWQGTVGGSAMGDEAARDRFVLAVRKACRIGKIFNDHGVRQGGVIRIDSAADDFEEWARDPAGNLKKIAATFRTAGQVAEEYGERLAAEGEICWTGLHTLQTTLDLLHEVDMPETVGFQADMAHTFLYLVDPYDPEHALLKAGYTQDEFWAAYETMTAALGPWVFDFHVAQNDGTVHGTGSHKKTGRHCPADDPNGKLDIVKCAGYWLNKIVAKDLRHICWDGCMFSNAVLENQQTWNTILGVMAKVRAAHGW